MKRRTFLFATGASCAATGLAWLRLRETGSPIRVARRSPAELLALDRARALREATARARAAGKPLLVLVVPDLTTRAGRELAWHRQELFGAWLNHGGDQALADLLLTEPVCASAFDVSCAFGSKRLPGWDPPCLLVDPKTGAVQAPDPDLPAILGDSSFARPMRQQVDAFAAALRGMLRGDADQLLELEAPTRAALGSAALARIEEAPDPARLPADLVDRGAAVLCSRALRLPEAEAARVTRVLADRARTRFVEAPLPGARWATSGGCGADIEDEEETSMVLCGMGFTSDLAERFLYFFTD